MSLLLPSTALRWEHWQSTPSSQQYLSPAARAEDYTLLHVPPGSRVTFFILVDMLLARTHLERQALTLLDKPDTLTALQDAQRAWQAWSTWTRRLAAYLERVARGKGGTEPPVPDALQGVPPLGEEAGDDASPLD